VLGEQGRLERMEGAAARMQNLIDDLLTLARFTAGLNPPSVDASEPRYVSRPGGCRFVGGADRTGRAEV